MTLCRCGWTGEGPHPCHARLYTCRKPATRRFYTPGPFSLAGMQLKFSVAETFACDECWEATRSDRERAATNAPPDAAGGTEKR